MAVTQFATAKLRCCYENDTILFRDQSSDNFKSL